MRNVLGNILESNLKFEKMKKLVFIFGIMLTMLACTGNSTKVGDAGDSIVVDSDSIVVDSIADSLTVDSIN